MMNLNVLPMPLVDCERGFSVLKVVKTRLCNSVRATNLNHSTMVVIEGTPLHQLRSLTLKKQLRHLKRQLKETEGRQVKSNIIILY